MVYDPEELWVDLVGGFDLLHEEAPEHYEMVISNIRKIYLSKDDTIDGDLIILSHFYGRQTGQGQIQESINSFTL